MTGVSTCVWPINVHLRHWYCAGIDPNLK